MTSSPPLGPVLPAPLRSGSDALVLYSTTAAWEGERFAIDLQLLPLAEQIRVLRFQRASDRRASLVGRLLLRQGLTLFGYGAEVLEALHYTSHGKPYLPGSDLNFNISHAGAYVVCAFALRNRVGIDLELIRSLPLADVRGTLAPEQWRYIHQAADPSRCFLTLWTMKEAIAKCRGEGLLLPLEAITGTAELALAGERWACRELSIAPGYICHAVAQTPPSAWQVRRGLNS